MLNFTTETLLCETQYFYTCIKTCFSQAKCVISRHNIETMNMLFFFFKSNYSINLQKDAKLVVTVQLFMYTCIVQC
jgi:hypothetical protein